MTRSAVSRFVDADGVALHAELLGRGRPVLLLHGFTGSTRSLEGVALGLSDAYLTIRLDLIGHGKSDAPRDAAAYAMSRCAAQIAAALRALGAPRSHVVGYSMGGRAALALCAAHPQCVASAVVIGARGPIEPPEARETRRRDDCALADRIEGQGVDAFVDEWMARPLFASQRRLDPEVRAAARAERLANRAHGLAGSLRGMGAGEATPLSDGFARVAMPVCLVAGADDARFGAFARDLARRLPAARVAIVAEAGHAVHLENPTEFLRVARGFFAAVDASDRDAEARSAQAPPRARSANL